VNSLQEYFHTDWAAMTQNDWIGLIMTVAIFFIMIAIYVYALHPSNREKLESQRFIPLDDERLDTEGRK